MRCGERRRDVARQRISDDSAGLTVHLELGRRLKFTCVGVNGSISMTVDSSGLILNLIFAALRPPGQSICAISQQMADLRDRK